MRIIITGGNGFIGKFLKSSALEAGNEVLAPSRQELDLTNEAQTTRLVTDFKPNLIYHLAGISRVNDSLGMPDYFAANTLTTFSLLKSLEAYKSPVHFFFASSMHVYGNQTGSVDESTLPEPLSYYAFTKHLSEQAIQKAAKEFPQSKFVIGRLYSCFGPAQPEGFVASDLVRKVLELKPNAVLKTGPLKTFRRFVDVRDAVRVLTKLLKHSHKSNCEVFNVVSPHECRIEEILQQILKLTGKSPKIESQADQNNSFLGLKVNTTKLFSIVEPKEFRPVESTLKDMVEYAKERANAS